MHPVMVELSKGLATPPRHWWLRGWTFPLWSLWLVGLMVSPLWLWFPIDRHPWLFLVGVLAVGAYSCYAFLMAMENLYEERHPLP